MLRSKAKEMIRVRAAMLLDKQRVIKAIQGWSILMRAELAHIKSPFLLLLSCYIITTRRSVPPERHSSGTSIAPTCPSPKYHTSSLPFFKDSIQKHKNLPHKLIPPLQILHTML